MYQKLHVALNTWKMVGMWMQGGMEKEEKTQVARRKTKQIKGADMQWKMCTEEYWGPQCPQCPHADTQTYCICNLKHGNGPSKNNQSSRLEYLAVVTEGNSRMTMQIEMGQCRQDVKM